MKIATILLTPVMALSAVAFAQSEAEFKTACTRLCAESAKAYNSKNIAWFDANSTADFVYINAQGKKEAKAAALAGLKGMFQQCKTINTKMKCGAMIFKNGVGRHTNVSTTTITLMGPDKKMHTMVVVSEVEDSFKRVNGKWKYSQVKEMKPPKMTMDGKPMNPNG